MELKFLALSALLLLERVGHRLDGLGYGAMQASALVVCHALVDGLPHEGVRETVEDIEIRYVKHLEEFLRLHV
jgi:hypothetical protein